MTWRPEARPSRSLRAFVKENRTEIEKHVLAREPKLAPLSESDCQDQVRNDEGLYNWAKAWGWRD